MIDPVDADRLADDAGRPYPYPLAATYNRAFYSTNDLTEMHEYLVDLFELVLKYCSAIAVSQYVDDALRDPTIDQDLLHLQRPSLGHWQGWLRGILKLYRESGHPLRVPELGDFYVRRDRDELLQAYKDLTALPQMGQERKNPSAITHQQFLEVLGTYRNRVRHGVQPSRFDRERAAKILGPALRALFKKLSFLAGYRLVYVSQVNVVFDSHPPRYSHDLTYLIGDTPRVARPQVTDQPTASQKVYLLDKAGDFQPLLSLHPFLIFYHCASCGREQPFLLNASDAGSADYIGYPCTHHFRPDQYFTAVRELLDRLQASNGGAAPPAPPPDPLADLYARGVRALDAERWDEAEDLFGQIVAARADFRDAAQKLGEIRRRRGAEAKRGAGERETGDEDASLEGDRRDRRAGESEEKDEDRSRRFRRGGLAGVAAAVVLGVGLLVVLARPSAPAPPASPTPGSPADVPSARTSPTSPGPAPGVAPAITTSTATPPSRTAPSVVPTGPTAVAASPTTAASPTPPAPWDALDATPAESSGRHDLRLDAPWALAVDGQGNIYVTDDANNRIQKLSPTGQLLAQWGKAGSDPGQFDLPEGLAVDRQGNIYVAEAINDRIQKLSPSGRPLAQWGSQGTGQGELASPVGVAVDGQGNVYVAEFGNNRVQKLSPSGQPLAQWGNQGSEPGQFSMPQGIAVDGQGNVYVADFGNNRIQKLSPTGDPLAQWGSQGSDPGQFNMPYGVAVDGQGNVYVAERGNARVQKLSPTGKPLAQWGTRAPGATQNPAPAAVAVDGQGNIYVANVVFNRVEKLSPAGQLLAVWGG